MIHKQLGMTQPLRAGAVSPLVVLSISNNPQTGASQPPLGGLCGKVPMTTELSSTAAADLPPRTWRQWWRQLPGYWRIAGWTVFILVLLHVALVAWMIPGYFESTEITKLRQHGAVIRYAWESNTGDWSDQYMNWLMPGIHGRSAAQVAEINLSDVFTDNRILEYIGQHFPNLQHLH